MKNFEHINKLFKLYKKPDPWAGGKARSWYIVKGRMSWLNDRDDDGKFIQITTYTELKKKIQDRLTIMGYSDVSEIPEDVEILCE